MDQNKNLSEGDPDYEVTTTAIRNLKRKEEQENELTEEKLKKIIQDEFDKELGIREKQLEDIEQQIFKAQKLLHIVRYVLITSYYNKKSLQYDTTQEEYTLHGLNTLKGQNRIHPAVKKLLGANAQNVKFLGARQKKRLSYTAKKKRLPNHGDEEIPFKKMKQETDETSSSSCSIDQQNLQKLASDSSSTDLENVLTNRQKIEHKILVGNISYCKKSLEQDNLTHKWMVYVRIYRGSKDGPDVSSMIKKVVFYLHPSYKPHDVVEISESPFHLSRRGWGEFPVRVQILFKNYLNKPVDIIHNLKLSKKFIGRQTLGNETEVPIFLHTDRSSVMENNHVENNTDDIQIKFEYTNEVANESNLKIKQENGGTFGEQNITESVTDFIEFPFDECALNTNSASLGLEHDYCFGDTVIKNEVEDEEISVINHHLDENVLNPEDDIDFLLESEEEPSSLDHSYSLPASAENSVVIEKSSDSLSNSSSLDQPQNELIYGLGKYYLTNGRRVIRTVRKTQKLNSVKNRTKMPKILKTASGHAIRFLPQSFSKVLLSNGSIVQVKLLNQTQPVLKRIDLQKLTNSQPALTQSNKAPLKPRPLQKINYEKYKVRLPEATFKNMGEALPYLFKRLPLWNELATDIDFKCIYPFTASSYEEYMSWNVGKRLSAEWARAKTIRRLLQSKPYSKRWNTKSIFMYGRSHLYTPLVSSYRLLHNKSSEALLLMDCFSKSEPRHSGGFKISVVDDVTEIDVESNQDISSRVVNGVTDVSDANLQPQCSFIREAALDCGVYLKPEEIVEGVTMNAAERVILEAVKCFAEGLIRRAQHHLLSQYHFNKRPTEITVSEINRALEERPEFKLIRNFQQQKFHMDFFS